MNGGRRQEGEGHAGRRPQAGLLRVGGAVIENEVGQMQVVGGLVLVGLGLGEHAQVGDQEGTADGVEGRDGGQPAVEVGEVARGRGGAAGAGGEDAGDTMTGSALIAARRSRSPASGSP